MKVRLFVGSAVGIFGSFLAYLPWCMAQALNDVSSVALIPGQLKVTRLSGGSWSGNDLIQGALAGATAKVTIVAWGVEFGSHHQIILNDVPRGELKPSGACALSTTEFNIALNEVRFPGSRGSGGNKPPPRENPLRFVLDGNPPCLYFIAASMTVKLMSPIVLIHGNNQDGSFFVDRGFTSELDNRHLLWDNSINLPTALRETNGAIIAGSLPSVADEFGVDSVHIVAHSKGGLDSREFLVRFYSRAFRPQVLSLNTLSSPHNGSVLADILVERAAHAKHYDVELPYFPAFFNTLAYLIGSNASYESLNTQACAQFNILTNDSLNALVQSIRFTAVGGDADSNNNLEHVPFVVEG